MADQGLKAMAGTRALNGITSNNSNNNYSNVLPYAQNAAKAFITELPRHVKRWSVSRS